MIVPTGPFRGWYTPAVSTRVELHPLPGSKRAAAVAALADELCRSGRTLLVWVADEGRRQIFDEYLWTFERLAFVPHGVWQSGMEGSADEPILLVGEPANPNGATVLVVGDEPPPLEWAATFAEVHDFLPPGPEGEQRAAYWQPLAG